MAETLTLRQAAPVRWAKVVDHTRCPWWLLRPLKPAREAYRLPGWAPPEKP